MKRLEDLKVEILNNKLNKFYVFYGEDYGIRHHYIKKIESYFESPTIYLDSYVGVESAAKTKTLFGPSKQLVVVYGDMEFLKLSEVKIQKFIDSLSTYYCIFEYEELSESSILYKNFSKYVTNFPLVQSNIAKEFVDSEISLNNKFAETLAFNCNNNYNNILLETDKIKTYSIAKGVTQQNAYEALYNKNQLLEKVDDFDVNEFMDDILCYSTNNLDFWYINISNNLEQFTMSLYFIFVDFIIAGLIKYYGKWEGGTISYNYHYSWTRTKRIRELPLKYSANDYYTMAYNVTEMDRKIKNGQLVKEKALDYFYSNVLIYLG